MDTNNLKITDAVTEGLSCPHCNKELVAKLDFENIINPLDLKCKHTKYIGFTEAGIIFMSDDFIAEIKSKGYKVDKDDTSYSIYNEEGEDVLIGEIHETLNHDGLLNYIVQEKNTGGPVYMQMHVYYGVSKH